MSTVSRLYFKLCLDASEAMEGGVTRPEMEDRLICFCSAAVRTTPARRRTGLCGPPLLKTGGELLACVLLKGVTKIKKGVTADAL